MAGFVLGDSRLTIYDSRFTIHNPRIMIHDSLLTTHDSEKMRQVKQKKTMEQEVYFRIAFIVF